MAFQTRKAFGIFEKRAPAAGHRTQGGWNESHDSLPPKPIYIFVLSTKDHSRCSSNNSVILHPQKQTNKQSNKKQTNKQRHTESL